MSRNSPTVNVSGLTEFIPAKAEPAPKQRIVVTVSKEDHKVLTTMADKASAAAGRFVSLGLVINSLIKHYESYE